LVGGRVSTIRACASCIRSGKVTKVPYNHSGARSAAS
jgi:ribosomal protein L28